MANKKQKPKRDHHVVPRLYLDGFVIRTGEPFIWVYKRGEEYNPGRGKITNNPYRDSIGRAAVERDYFADPKDGAPKDFETFENKLEALEKPANPIFGKLRACKPIDETEKALFSIYIVQMHRRVQAGREIIKEMLPQVVANYEPSKDLFQKSGFPETPEVRAHFKEISKRVSKKTGYAIQMHNRLAASASESLLVDVLKGMKWHFLVAPEGDGFLASDNPVYIPYNLGLKHVDAELSFPLSTKVALVTSWRECLTNNYVEVTPRIVKEVNRRTSSNALRNVYCSHDSQWAVSLLNNSKYEYRPIVSRSAR